MNLLECDMYIRWHVVNDEEVVRDIFWTHPNSVKLLNAFNIVFFMNSMYKINMYRLPLLEIVGVMCIGMTFSVVFAYLEVERENNFVWAFERFRGLFFVDLMDCRKWLSQTEI